ncbi:hypothetical protein ACP3PM_28440 (plasmid) [Pseudomonas iridis]
MQRLAKPSDYVRQEVLGQSTFVLPWEPRLCPGNPADDPELGAQIYNEFACASAQGVTQRSRGSGSNGTVNALKPSTCPQTSALSGEYDKTTVL